MKRRGFLQAMGGAVAALVGANGVEAAVEPKRQISSLSDHVKPGWGRLSKSIDVWESNYGECRNQLEAEKLRAELEHATAFRRVHPSWFQVRGDHGSEVLVSFWGEHQLRRDRVRGAASLHFDAATAHHFGAHQRITLATSEAVDAELQRIWTEGGTVTAIEAPQSLIDEWRKGWKT